MLDRLAAKGVPADRQFLLPNWTDTAKFFPTAREPVYRRRLGIGVERCVALYSGSLGVKQGLDHLIGAARILSSQSDDSPLFVIAGGGSAREGLVRSSLGLSNVMFLPPQPEETLNEFLNIGDIQLLPQLGAVNDLVLPSKLGAMLAIGKPIVATVHPGSLIADTIKDAGVLVPPGHPELLADEILELARSPQRRAAMGQAARMIAARSLQPQDIFLQTEDRLQKLVTSDGRKDRATTR